MGFTSITSDSRTEYIASTPFQFDRKGNACGARAYNANFAARLILMKCLRPRAFCAWYIGDDFREEIQYGQFGGTVESVLENSEFLEIKS